MVYGKHYDACSHYSPSGYRKELGGIYVITSPARFVICVNGIFGYLVLLVDITNCIIGAGSEDRGVPIISQSCQFHDYSTDSWLDILGESFHVVTLVCVTCGEF